VIYNADSDADARAWMEADPAVSGGLMTAELHPFRISLSQSN